MIYILWTVFTYSCIIMWHISSNWCTNIVMVVAKWHFTLRTAPVSRVASSPLACGCTTMMSSISCWRASSCYSCLHGVMTLRFTLAWEGIHDMADCSRWVGSFGKVYFRLSLCFTFRFLGFLVAWFHSACSKHFSPRLCITNTPCYQIHSYIHIRRKLRAADCGWSCNESINDYLG